MTRIVVVGLMAACGMSIAFAQEPKLTFEVASVRKQAAFVPPTPPSGEPTSASPVAFRRSNATVVSLLRFAYDVMEYQVTGGPEWVSKDLFEVNARAAAEVSTDEMRLMVRSLLEDRFKLVLRKENREMRSYVMMLAREDGRVGPRLQQCVDSNVRPTPTPVRVPAGSYPFSGRCVSIAVIARSASGLMGAPVVDKSGLTGLWTFQLFYAQPDPLPPGPERELAERENLLPFPAAFQQELGLKLESTRGPVEVFVIESVQQPTEN